MTDAPTEVLRRSIVTGPEEPASNWWEDVSNRLVDYGHVFAMELEVDRIHVDKLYRGEAVNIDTVFNCVLTMARARFSSIGKPSGSGSNA